MSWMSRFFLSCRHDRHRHTAWNDSWNCAVHASDQEDHPMRITRQRKLPAALLDEQQWLTPAEFRVGSVAPPYLRGHQHRAGAWGEFEILGCRQQNPSNRPSATAPQGDSGPLLVPTGVTSACITDLLGIVNVWHMWLISNLMGLIHKGYFTAWASDWPCTMAVLC